MKGIRELMPAVRRVVLEKLGVSLRRELRMDFVANHAELALRVDEMTRRFVADLQSFVLAFPESRITEATVEAPADWWQAVRERWLPRWWLRRWPVRKRVVETLVKHTTYRVCPHADIQEEGPHAHIDWLVGGEGPCLRSPADLGEFPDARLRTIARAVRENRLPVDVHELAARLAEQLLRERGQQ